MADEKLPPEQASADSEESLTTSPISSLTSEPPDGGLQAWTQVLVTHLVSFNSWGYLNSFGVFQSYYVTTLSASPSAVSWIGSVQVLLCFLVGCVSGRALDAGYLRTTLAAGAALQILGIFASSAATEYWQLLLAQGLCKGLGDGLCFCPAVAVVSTYFARRRAVAMAIGAAGTATGGIVFPLIAQQLMPRVGFGWTVRVMGFVVVFNAAVILTLSRARLTGRKGGPLLAWDALRERPFALFCAGMFFNWWALYFAFFYVSAFAKTILHVDTSTSITLLLLMNAVGGPGRILFGWLSDRLIGPLTALISVALMTGVLFFGWAGVSSLGGLYAFCTLYGFIGPGIQSLFAPACTLLTDDMKTIGARTGIAFGVVSIAALTGPPIGGALIQRADGEYLYAQMFGGSSLAMGALCILGAKVLHDRKLRAAM